MRVLIFIFCFLAPAPAWAMEVYLKNGDKITGTVKAESSTWLQVATLAAGEVKIDKSFIDLPKTFPEKYGLPPAAPAPPPVIWKKDFSLGFTQEGGNTKAQAGNLSTDIDRKTAIDEYTFKYDADYTSANGVMNGRKFYGMGRYAFSFGPRLNWYNFYKMEGDQDYFADIEYRLTPAAGVGYWFSNTPDWKALTELGAGYEYDDYRIQTTPNEGQVILTPRFFADKRLIANLHLSEDVTFYPSLQDGNDYRLRSETGLINQFNSRWSLKISYIYDFSNFPPPDFKKSDYTFVTSLEYHF